MIVTFADIGANNIDCTVTPQKSSLPVRLIPKQFKIKDAMTTICKRLCEYWNNRILILFIKYEKNNGDINAVIKIKLTNLSQDLKKYGTLFTNILNAHTAYNNNIEKLML